MVCIYCSSKTKVTNSRSSDKRRSTWRRRECLGCNAVFTTREQADLESSIRISDKMGSVVPFSRDRLFISLYSSLTHRKAALADCQGLTDTIITRLLDRSGNGIYDRTEIIATAKEALSKFDNAAHTHYAAHHEN